jgi:hypothetical protein
VAWHPENADKVTRGHARLEQCGSELGFRAERVVVVLSRVQDTSGEP